MNMLSCRTLGTFWGKQLKVRDMKIDIGGAALCFMESENDNFGLKIDGKEDYKYYESKGVFFFQLFLDFVNHI